MKLIYWLLLALTLPLLAHAAVKVEQCPQAGTAFTVYGTVLPTLPVPMVFSNDATGDANTANLHCALLKKAKPTWYAKVTSDNGATWTWAPMASLTAPVVVPTTANLAWVAPTLDMAGAPFNAALTYNIYRGPSASALTLLKNVSGLTTTDTVTVDGTYWYAVTSNCTNCVESPKSAAVSAVLASGTVVSPAPPSGVSVSQQLPTQ